MTQPVTHNIDEASEFFRFIVNGTPYLFRYPNTEEVEDFEIIFSKETDNSVKKKEFANWIKNFVRLEGDGLDFEEQLKKMNIRQIKNFRKMIESELGYED